jgi:hypothetical protein
MAKAKSEEQSEKPFRTLCPTGKSDAFAVAASVAQLVRPYEFVQKKFPVTSFDFMKTHIRGFGEVRLAMLGLMSVLGTLSSVSGADLFSQTGVDLGTAGRTKQWAVLTLGSGLDGGLNISAPKGANGDEVVGPVGIAGTGSSLVLSGQGNILGNAFLNTGNAFSKIGAGGLSGTMFQDSTYNDMLAQAAADAESAAGQAASLPATDSSITNILGSRGRNLSFTSLGQYVMQLTDFVMSGGSTLTLNGAAGSAFVLNISGNFNIGAGSKILLTGGLRASDVLFNITGTSAALTRQISGDALFNGTILATKSTVTVSGHKTVVNGELVAQRVVVQSGATINNAPVSNPPPVDN